MSKEIDLEQRCREHVEELGGKLLKLKVPGHKGIHDRLLILPRYVAFVEFKHPNKKGRLSELQKRWQKFFNSMHLDAFKVDDFTTFLGICKWARKARDM